MYRHSFSKNTANKALHPTMNFPHFNGHQNQTIDEVSDAEIQQPQENLAIHK